MPLMSMRAYARYRGVSPEAVSKAVKLGRISTVLDERGKRVIDPAVADTEWLENSAHHKRQSPTIAEKKAAASSAPPEPPHVEAPPLAGSDSSAPAGPSYNRSRAIREAFNAKIAQIEYEEKIKKLISAEKVRVSAFKSARIVRDAIMNIPNRISADLASETDPQKVRIMLTDALNEALQELASENLGFPSS